MLAEQPKNNNPNLDKLLDLLADSQTDVNICEIITRAFTLKQGDLSEQLSILEYLDRIIVKEHQTISQLLSVENISRVSER